MRSRRLLHQRSLGVLLGAALLSGCGGSGSPGIQGPPPIARPNAVGTQAQFSGTLTETDVNNLIAAGPVSTTSSAALTEGIATGSDSAGNSTFTASETAASPLRTVTTTTVATVAYQPQASGSVAVRALKTVASDSNGVVVETDYGSSNGLLTNLPETAGSFSNDAKATYKETDPGQNLGTGGSQNVTTERDVNADGSYAQTTGTFDFALAPATNTAQLAPDFSGTLKLNNLPGGRTFTFSAPAGGTITYVYHNGAGNNGAGSDTTSTVPNWIPAGQTVPSVETDTIAPGAALGAGCQPAAKYGSTATKVTQTITAADAVLGTLETRVSTAYDILGAGTICATVADTIQTFYDFSEQEGPAPRLFPSGSASVPAETVTVAETLSLQSTTAPGASAVRRAPAALAGGGVFVPPALIGARARNLVHQLALRRLAGLRQTGGSSL